MIGCGSMGGGMALLFAENGIEVSLQDPSVEAMDLVIKTAKKDEIPPERLKKYTGRLFPPCPAASLRPNFHFEIL